MNLQETVLMQLRDLILRGTFELGRFTLFRYGIDGIDRIVLV